MGQDFRAIVDHGIAGNDIVWLPSMLDSLLTEISVPLKIARLEGIRTDRGYPPEHWTWGWDSDNDPPFEEWVKGPVVSLFGPASLFLDLGLRCARFGCWVRWSEFLLKPEISEALREITFRLSNAIASGVAIYLPDSAWPPAEHAYAKVNKGSPIDEIIEQLQVDAGPPAPSIQALYRWVEPIPQSEVSRNRLSFSPTVKPGKRLNVNGCYIDWFRADAPR